MKREKISTHNKLELLLVENGLKIKHRKGSVRLEEIFENLHYKRNRFSTDNEDKKKLILLETFVHEMWDAFLIDDEKLMKRTSYKETEERIPNWMKKSIMLGIEYGRETNSLILTMVPYYAEESLQFQIKNHKEEMKECEPEFSLEYLFHPREAMRKLLKHRRKQTERILEIFSNEKVLFPLQTELTAILWNEYKVWEQNKKTI